jgi:large subunit ribosomal protein L10
VRINVSTEVSQGRSERSEKIEAVKKLFKASNAGVLTDFRGLKVSQITELRRRFVQQKISYRVLKNTLVKIAVKGTPLEDLSKMLEGPTGIAFSLNDPVTPARIVREFAKDNEALKIKGGFIDDEVLSQQQIVEVSKLPGLQELRAQFLSALNAPMQQLLGVLNELPQKFVGVLEAKEEQAKGAEKAV